MVLNLVFKPAIKVVTNLFLELDIVKDSRELVWQFVHLVNPPVKGIRIGSLHISLHISLPFVKIFA